MLSQIQNATSLQVASFIIKNNLKGKKWQRTKIKTLLKKFAKS